MKTNKILKISSIILETFFIGSIVLYIYNYYIASKKYDIIPAVVKTRLNAFIIIAIISFIVFLIIKYVMYLRNKPIYTEQLQMDLTEEEKEQHYRNLEAPITERVFLYKNEYDVPKERQMNCPNCNSIIDKNAHICIKCGYLLKNIVQQKIVERVIEKPEYRNDNYVIRTNNNYISRDKLINILINLGLVIAIIIVLILIINQGIQRGIIG